MKGGGIQRGREGWRSDGMREAGKHRGMERVIEGEWDAVVK